MLNKASYMVGATFETVSETSDIADAELKRAMGNNEKQKVIDALYSLSVLTDDVQRKQRELAKLQKSELEMLEALQELTPEQIERKQQREMELALHNYIKSEMDNIKIPALEAWLANYRIAYTEMCHKYFDGFELSMRMNETEKMVRNQKMNIIIIRSFEKVGKLVDVNFGTIGMNGEFNGIVIGERGTASIRTILAGGYNIQRLHYRVLVN